MPKRRNNNSNEKGGRGATSGRKSSKSNKPLVSPRRPWASSQLEIQTTQRTSSSRSPVVGGNQATRSETRSTSAGGDVQTNNSQHQPQHETAELLVNLHNACLKHGADHEVGGNLHAGGAGDNNQIPEQCRKAYNSLKEILPKVEAAFEPPPSIGDVEGDAAADERPAVAAHDVATLCDFYESILSGAYCPHLPQLFAFNQNPKQVLDKVFYLLKHIVCRSLLEKSRLSFESNDNDTMDDEASLQGVVDVISRTIGSLLTFVPCDNSIYSTILRDLINIIADCNEILDSPFRMLPIRMLILCDCYKRFSTQLVDDDGTTNHEQQSSGGYFLLFQSVEQVWLLQSATFHMIQTFLSDIQAERLIKAERLELNTPSENDEGGKSSYYTSGTIDLMFHDDLMNHDTRSLLLENLEDILWFDDHVHCDDQNNKKHPYPPMIWQRRQASALSMLSKIVEEWHHQSSSSVNSSLLYKAKNIVAQSTLAYYKVRTLQSKTDDGKTRKRKLKSNKDDAYSNLLVGLLQNTILNPPISDEVYADCSGNNDIQVLPALLDCLVPIAAKKCNDHLNHNIAQRSDLDTTVLRILDSILQKESQVQSFAVEYATCHGLFKSIFDLIRDPLHSNFALGIFGNLSHDVTRFQSLTDLEQLCLNEVERHVANLRRGRRNNHKEGVDNEALAMEEQEESTNKVTRSTAVASSGTKRKRDGSERAQPQLSRAESNTSQQNGGEATLLNPNTSGGVFSWHEMLRTLLRDGLASGTVLTEKFCLNGGDTNRQHGISCLSQAGLVMGALKCVCYTLILNYDPKNNLHREFEPMGCLKMMNHLFNYLKKCCDHILFLTSSKNNNDESLSDTDKLIAEISSSCCLFLHYSTCEIFFEMKGCKEFLELGKTLVEIASIGIKLAANGLTNFLSPPFSISTECSRPRRMYCLQSVVGMPCREIRDSYYMNTCNKRLCICGYFEQLESAMIKDQRSEQVQKSSFTSTMSALESLPLRSQYSLLQSLVLGSWSPSPPHSDLIHSLTIYKQRLESVTSVMEQCMQEYSAGDSRQSLAICLLNLVPPLLVSMANKVGKDKGISDLENSNSDSQWTLSEESFRDLSGDFIEKTLKSILSSVKQSSDELDECVLLVVNRLQSFRGLSTGQVQGLWEMNAHSTVDLLFGRNVFTEKSSEYSSHLEIDEVVNRLISEIAKKIQGFNASHFARKLLWAGVANFVVCTPPQEFDQATTSNGPELIDVTANDCVGGSRVSWLLESAFTDPDPSIRDYISRRIAKVAMNGKYAFLLSISSTDGDLQSTNMASILNEMDISENCSEVQATSERITNNFFSKFDHLVSGRCGLSGSPLSLTVTKSALDVSGNVEDVSRETGAEMQRLAARILVSLCQLADLEHPIGISMHSAAHRRLVRLWAANTERVETSFMPEPPSTESCRALTFPELTRLSQLNSSQPSPVAVLSDRAFSDIFCDIWLQKSKKEIQFRYQMLANFIQCFLLDKPDGLTRKRMLKETSSYFESKLAMFIGHLILEKAQEPISLAVGFREFLFGMLGEVRKKLGFERSMAGASDDDHRYRYWSLRDLEKKSKNLCLERALIGQFLPRILLKDDDGGILKFFKKHILREDVEISSVITPRKLLILKGLAWELGRDEATKIQAQKAIKLLAISTLQDSQSTSDDEDACMKSGASLKNSGTESHDAAAQLVTSNLLYLCVNVVQLRWNMRSMAERRQALRALCGLIDFLFPSAAAQYFPHILAIVNSAILINQERTFQSLHLGYEAVKCLSKFIELVAGHDFGPVAQNLMTVVVTLIPLLEDDSTKEFKPGEEIIQESRHAAVLLLELLTRGELGKFLAPHFRDIPFLPQSPCLGNVHKALRENGVDYDNLVVLSNASQESKVEGISTTFASETNDSRGSSSSWSGAKVSALKRRINTICTLLSNENTSVRNIALRHLIDLLRSNRCHFSSLVENEAITTTQMYLTVMFPDQLSPRGTVTEMMETLLMRCVEERDPATRVLLATCLGEVGAIGEYYLGDLNIGGPKRDDSLDAGRWRMELPPWQSRSAKYELELVTRHLVVGLKAAPSTTDQHRIGFTIQQLLQQLDQATNQGELSQGQPQSTLTKNAAMGEWLKGKLNEAKVLEIVEPYWHSKFQEKEDGFLQKPPPFVSVTPSYFKWISKFCRWMIQSVNVTPNSKNSWKIFFYNCRQAIQAEAGLKVAEFLFPLLILDRLCSDSLQEEELIRQEFLDVLDVGLKHESMTQTDRQKAVSAVFSVLDTLQSWAETGKEALRKSSRASKSRQQKRKASRAVPEQPMNTSWPSEKAIARIDEMLSKIPLDKQALAASFVGMHAKALQLLENAGRKETVQQIFESPIDPSKQTPKYADHATSSIELRKDLLAQLDDCESMAALSGDNLVVAPSIRVRDSFRRKEANSDYEGALKDYERALQLIGHNQQNLDLEKGVLRCQLELGHFESVLKQTAGLKAIGGERCAARTKLFAVEAAWRLGRWEALSELVDDKEDQDRLYSPNGCDTYQVCIGNILLGLQKQEANVVVRAVHEAREGSLDSLSIVARENYTRSYPDIVRLHCLRELENAAELLLSERNGTLSTLDEVANSNTSEGWEWDSRLNLATSKGSSSIISTRVALARIGAEPELQGSLFLSIGKQARKQRLYGIAENYLSQAESVLSASDINSSPSSKLGHLLYSTRVQVAKLKHECGESTLALRILGQESVQSICDQMLLIIGDESKIRNMAVAYERNVLMKTGIEVATDTDTKLSDRFVSRLLKSTQWMIEGGLTGGSAVVNRFRVIHVLAPSWEKGHFRFAKFVESMMQARVTTLSSKNLQNENCYSKDEDGVRSYVVTLDGLSQQYILESMLHYVAALKISNKHVYQALPRLLSLWFEFTSIQWNDSDAEYKDLHKRNHLSNLAAHQGQANKLMAEEYSKIPASAFYTAIPQLVSRLTHDDKDTAIVVQSILVRVLSKFPLEAMWPLAWLKGSKNQRRAEVGEQIFKHAQRNLQKSNRKMQKVLSDAGDLISFLKSLATYNGSSDKDSIYVKPWKGNVDLSEFIPPVQAALSASPKLSGDGRKEFFPRDVPRMRAFNPNISVMSSKARPKKLKAFVIPAGRRVSTNGSLSSPQKGDIGEIHFLVKQEAKGDLRKDARVQDLNNFINRLMASNGSASRNKRKIRLRTFQVTCLSEDTGILEWVPDTESLRNLVGRTYNPQTTSYCPRRRGHRITSFTDPSLRSEYDRAQNLYFKEGNPGLAGSKFKELCLKFPPIFYWWFVQNFHDPHAWYEGRNRFALSSAAWSAVGHIIGLGDRHSENILLDTTSGQCVHVDFDCIFDKGLDLPRPEIIPFRLTQNMMDAFGPTGYDGIYSSGLQTAISTLRNNRDTLLSVLEPFTKDPVIDWRRSKSNQKQKPAQIEDYQKSRAKRAIQTIDERLQGIYNLKNPNLRKIQRKNSDPDVSITSMTPLSVEGQVTKMIQEATSNENLVQLYVGWMPWI